MEDLSISADKNIVPMDQSEVDPFVDEEMIDPNGSLLDQVMDILHSGGSFTVKGVLDNILMCSNIPQVVECLRDLESQGLAVVVGTSPLRWEHAAKSPTRTTGEKSSNVYLPHPPMRYEDPPVYQPFNDNGYSREKLSMEAVFKSNQLNQQKPSFVSDIEGTSDVSGFPIKSTPFGYSSSPGKMEGQKQSNVGCPPPPSAELFKSLMSQCKYPSAPVKNTGSSTMTQHPSTPQGLSSSQNNHFSATATSISSTINIRPPSGQVGLGSHNGNKTSRFPIRATSPPSLMDNVNPPFGQVGFGSQKPDPSKHCSSRTSPPSDNDSFHSSFGQASFGSQQANNTNRFPEKAMNPPYLACDFDPPPRQTGFGSEYSVKSFSDFHQKEPEFPSNWKTAQREETQNKPHTPNPSGSFPQPPSAQMFRSLLNKGPQTTKAPSSENQIKKLTELESRLLEFMKQTGKQCDTLQISRGVGLRTKKEVNPSLYHLQSMGLIMKMHDHPPTWKIRSENLLAQTQGKGSSERQPSSGQHFSRKDNPSLGFVSGIPSFPHNCYVTTQKLSQQSNHFGKRSFSVDDRPQQKAAHYSTEDPSNKAHSFAQPEAQTQALSKVVHSAINQNPISALNEYAQKNRMELKLEVINEGRNFNKPPFTVAAVLDGKMFPAATASTSKDARREACDMALRVLLGQNLDPTSSGNQINLSQPNLTHFDVIAALSQHAFVQIAASIPENIAGRKVVACIAMKKEAQDNGVVVSLGSGNRCVTGQRLSMEGKVVNDSHAEIVARRSLHRFLYSQLNSFFDGQESIFEKMNSVSHLKLKDGISFHLYISTAPCGDGALFTPRVNDTITQPAIGTEKHLPEFTAKTQGILRTKIEDGEGTIPIDPNEGAQTWDGLLRGERLRTMSCSDKICRWNVVGLQGALLSHFIEPIYLESLTLGYLYDHGHLSRAVCCRLDHKNNLGADLPKPFKLNHPLLGRVTAYEATRHTEKTNNVSVNWVYGDATAEVTDGRTGACLSRTSNSPTPSRICKASLYNLFKEVCSKARREDLLHVETYREAKNKATDFQNAKRLMYECFRKSKYGSWVSKPSEQELF